MSLDKFVYLLLDNAVKYFFISLPFFLVYYVFFRKKLSYKKIQEKFPKMKDYYFYWAHRIMHHPWLFKTVHLVPHKSTNPSPWAAYAFHPFEAIVESLIFVIFLFTIPVHSIHLMWFFVISLVYNVYGHLGFEIYPKGFNKHWLGKWMNTSVSHNQHHQFFKSNYGLYFTIWDRLMGTMNKNYDKAFQEITSREKLSQEKEINNLKSPRYEI